MAASESLKIAASNIRKASVEKRHQADQLRRELDQKLRDKNREFVYTTEKIRNKAKELNQADDSVEVDHRKTEIRELDQRIAIVKTESDQERKQLENQIKAAEQDAVDFEQEAKNLEAKAANA